MRQNISPPSRTPTHEKGEEGPRTNRQIAAPITVRLGIGTVHGPWSRRYIAYVLAYRRQLRYVGDDRTRPAARAARAARKQTNKRSYAYYRSSALLFRIDFADFFQFGEFSWTSRCRPLAVTKSKTRRGAESRTGTGTKIENELKSKTCVALRAETSVAGIGQRDRD
ncbi:hypothetical protein EVAR_11177_1 [Eumeta japonica]|uniref:Uncharacterized protein n=1 Tax=Eumeta variegata TaxID=151549 RepID=A0A4C1U5M2_EUMVA|nr:hypothetical protein EVAR_11177_1 [Eumeta japonica]